MKIAEFKIDTGELQDCVLRHENLVFLRLIRGAAAAGPATAGTPASASPTSAATCSTATSGGLPAALTSWRCRARFRDFPDLHRLLLGIDLENIRGGRNLNFAGVFIA